MLPVAVQLSLQVSGSSKVSHLGQTDEDITVNVKILHEYCLDKQDMHDNHLSASRYLIKEKMKSGMFRFDQKL